MSDDDIADVGEDVDEPVEDEQWRRRLVVIDRSVDPGPDFADRLEHRLFDENADPPPPRWSARARPAALVLAAVAVIVALVALSRPTSDRTLTGPAQTTTETTTETSSPETETVERMELTQFSGILPNGERYDLVVEPGISPVIFDVYAPIVVEIDDQVRSVGQVTMRPGSFAGTSTGATAGFDGRVLNLATGGWIARIEFDAEVLDALAAVGDPELLVTDGIRAGRSGSLELSSPFRWPMADEGLGVPEVRYPAVVVRPGCGQLAAACSARRAVQLIPAGMLYSAAEPWVPQLAFIDSPAARPETDPFHLDRGPLSPRGDHQVLWTDDEMIVWGGAPADSTPNLIDGAAFNPTTNTWRTLAQPPEPLDRRRQTKAVWNGSELVVLSQAATLAYDPAVDSWRTIGEGVAPGRPIWAGRSLHTINAGGVFTFDEADGTWTELPGAEVADVHDDWRGSRLLAVGDELFIHRGCSTRLQRWSGSEWLDLGAAPDEVTGTTAVRFCPWNNQWAVVDGLILTWGDQGQPVLAYDPAQGTWAAIATVPLTTVNRGGGVLEINGGRLLITAGVVALFDVVERIWQPVELPGWSNPDHLVWTGTEVLMWGGACCYGSGNSPLTIDAWRWAPSAR